MRTLVGIGLLLLAVGCHGFMDLNVPITNTWWTMLNKVGGLITEDQLTEFFGRYMGQPPVLHVLECWEDDFTGGSSNWPTDFGTTVEVARAYFRVFNFYEPIGLLITEDDTLRLFRWIDADRRGTVDETEFKDGMPKMMRHISWAVMFVRHAEVSSETITTADFRSNIFDQWDANNDGMVTLSEFDAYWQQNGYGNAQTAQDAHTTLDFDQDGSISRGPDLDELFSRIDQGNDGILDFVEFTDIDLLIYGWRYP